jgi:hypothetical protein
MLLLQKSGVSATSDDKAKMARLISYLTDFSEEKIRQRLSNTDELTSYHREEVEAIKAINKIDISTFNPLPQEREKIDVPEKRNRQLAKRGQAQNRKHLKIESHEFL